MTGTKIQLDRERTLVFDFLAYRTIEERTGHSVLQDGMPMAKFGSVSFFLEVLRAGLLREDPTVTIEAIEEHLSAADGAPVLEAVAKALAESFSKPKATAATANPPVATP